MILNAQVAVVWMARGPGQRTYYRVLRSRIYGAMVK
jgi:hypothetical protein